MAWSFSLTTETFKELDTDGSGEIELDLMKVMCLITERQKATDGWFIDYS